MPTNTNEVETKMYFHGGVGTDSLWIRTWRPTSVWGMAGVCLAVFLLAGLERWLMAHRRGCEHEWSISNDEGRRDSESSITVLRRISSTSTAYQPLDPGDLNKPEGGVWSPLPRAERRSHRSFRWGVDLSRGAIQALQTTLHYLLMLVVMTFNVWWTISVILGAGVGEVYFGRLGAGHDEGNQ